MPKYKNPTSFETVPFLFIMDTYTKNHIVNASEIDHLNHVNNVVYLQWINDISIEHWNKIATKKIKENYSWVAIRHEIDYLKSAFLKEEIILKTYITSLKGVKSIRKVEIYKKEILIAKSETTWCLLDAKTQKIARIPNEISILFQ